MRTAYAWMAAVVMVALAASGCDRKNDQYRVSEKLNTSNSDEKFVWNAGQANLTEIEAGKLAQASASDAEVRRFGQKMIEEHTAANTELAALAQRKGFKMPTQPDESHRKDLSKLAEYSGGKFDREFMSMMVSDHRKVVDMFEDTAKDGKDADVRDFARKMVPSLKEHHRMASDLKDRLKNAPAAD